MKATYEARMRRLKSKEDRAKKEHEKKKEKAASQEAQNKMKKQMGMFDRLPDACSTCEENFPKTHEAHKTWRVVVKTEKEKVWLFCPDCQQKAKQLVENNNEI